MTFFKSVIAGMALIGIATTAISGYGALMSSIPQEYRMPLLLLVITIFGVPTILWLFLPKPVRLGR